MSHIRNEDMTRAEAKKALKGIDANVLGPARNTRSQDKTTRSQGKVISLGITKK